jgi:hypothetical protein
MSVCLTVLYTLLALTVWHHSLNGSCIKAYNIQSQMVNVHVLRFEMCFYQANHITGIKMQCHRLVFFMFYDIFTTMENV